MTPAEELRLAARMMRYRANKATPGICPQWIHSAVRHVARNCDVECTCAHCQRYVNPPEWDRYNDAGHIAAWTPPVALALADWLDSEAFAAEAMESGASPRALAVARAYLGGAS